MTRLHSHDQENNPILDLAEAVLDREISAIQRVVERAEIRAEVERKFLPPDYGHRQCAGCGLPEQLTVIEGITYSNLATWARMCKPCLENAPEPEVDESEACAESDRYEHARAVTPR
jgi:hypothetical protein